MPRQPLDGGPDGRHALEPIEFLAGRELGGYGGPLAGRFEGELPALPALLGRAIATVMMRQASDENHPQPVLPFGPRLPAEVGESALRQEEGILDEVRG